MYYKLVMYSKMNPEINPLNIKRINSRLLEMINKTNPQVGYITSETEENYEYFTKAKRYYEYMGIKNVIYFDLDHEYNDKNEKNLFNSDVIHLAGGNTYKFLSLLKYRNMIDKSRAYADIGGILVGVSAGGLIMAENIKSAQFGDENKIGLNDLDSLGLINFQITPHWNIFNNYIDELKNYSRNNKTTIYTVSDGEGIVVENNEIELYGKIGEIKDGVFKGCI